MTTPQNPLDPQSQVPQAPPVTQANPPAYQQPGYGAPAGAAQGQPAYQQPGYGMPAQGQQAYQQPPVGYAPAQPPFNVMSIIALVLSVIGISIVGVILGHVALSQIKKRGEGGKPLAIIALVLGYIGCVAWILIIISVIVPLVMLGSVVGDPSFLLN